MFLAAQITEQECYLSVEPVAEFIDPVRELKPALKLGLKGAMTRTHFNPTLKLALTPRTGSVNSATD